MMSKQKPTADKATRTSIALVETPSLAGLTESPPHAPRVPPGPLDTLLCYKNSYAKWRARLTLMSMGPYGNAR